MLGIRNNSVEIGPRGKSSGILTCLVSVKGYGMGLAWVSWKESICSCPVMPALVSLCSHWGRKEIEINLEKVSLRISLNSELDLFHACQILGLLAPSSLTFIPIILPSAAPCYLTGSLLSSDP